MLDDSKVIMDDFEQLLQKKSFKRPSVLYKEVPKPIEPAYKPQDVIESVYSQMKAIHLADRARSDKIGCKDFSSAKRSHFLTVNKLPVYSEVPKLTTNKFETQCVSDTQLIDIIEGAEAIETHTGMTQEFDMTFANTVDKNCNKNTHNEPNDCINNDKEKDNPPFTNKNVREEASNSIIEDIFDSNINIINIREHISQNPKEIEINSTIYSDTIPAQEVNSQFFKTDAEDTASFIENISLSQEKNDDIINSEQKNAHIKIQNISLSQAGMKKNEVIDSKELNLDTGQYSERSPSPVLNMKTIKRISRTPSPLIVPLESFENFEHIAMSIIDKTGEIETAKHFINSQILGRELLFNTNTNVMFADRNYSPILGLISDELQINSQDLKTPIKNILDNAVSLQEVENVIEKRSDSLKDEILFSSDEENIYIQEELHALPLTCALETPFYDEPGVFEKTMYVGFQTASNKSIQIFTDSFDRAKSIFDDDYDKTGKEFSLTELVEKCDTLNSNFQKSNNARSADVTTKTSVEIEVETKSGSIRAKDRLDLDENFQTTNLLQTDNECKSKVRSNENKKNGNCSKNIRRNSIDDKINDELLLEEFENIEMSLGKKDIISEINNYIATESSNNMANDKISSKDFKINEHSSYIKSQMFKTFTGVDNSGSVSMIGFKTASNKNIMIPEQALVTTKHTFQDIDNNKDTGVLDGVNQQSTSNASYVGFKTANNKHIKISEDDLYKSKSIFKDIDKNNSAIETIGDIDQPSTSKAVFVGFKTANNKNIKISDIAFSRPKIIFKDIEKEIPAMETIEYSDQPLKKNDVGKELKTVTFSGDVLPKSNNVFEGIKIYPLKNDTIENITYESNCESMLIGFKTANNKNINISDKALTRSKNIFKDIDKETSAMEIIEEIDKPQITKAKIKETMKSNVDNFEIVTYGLPKAKNISEDIGVKSIAINAIEDIYQPSTSKAVFEGFKTANDKNFKISDISVSKSKNFFKDLDKTDSTLSEIESKEAAFEGFKTASNKTVNISEQALANTKQLFESIDSNDGILVPKIAPKDQDNKDFIGFKTANNRPVKICAESMEKSKKLFADLDSADFDSETQLCIKDNRDKSQTFQGFLTANKKPVTVSVDAITRTKRIFHDIDKNENVNEKIPKINNFKGFQTANSKTVEVSNKALIASKNLFEDTKYSQIKCAPNSFVGFKTASNKNVNISKEGLAKCKKIFEDIEDTAQDLTESVSCQTKENMFKGFLTASNKEVEISKRALEKSKKFFDDIDSDKNESIYLGFQTASNKEAPVSEQALVNSRKLFKDVYTENDITECTKAVVEITDRIIPKKVNNNFFGFKTGKSKKIKVSEYSLINTKNMIAEKDMLNKNGITSRVKSFTNVKGSIETIKDNSINLDCLINTQILNNFEENMCTEDFKETPKPNKRSGSPILSCPRAKKTKKFETPYKSISKTVIDCTKSEQVKKVSHVNFKENFKKEKRYTLKDLTNLEKDINESVPIDVSIMNYNLENILNFEFDKERNDLRDGKMTIEEIKRLFIEATDKKLIPDGWLDIQLKLILWKLISYEIKFPKTLNRVCTVKNVIDQLKYRYDKELYNAERPILRKVLEKDDVSTRNMVLCVAGICVDDVNVTSATTNIEVLLTDGWYFIKATIDKMLSRLVREGKITVGSKIATCGAELVGGEQGIAPWEDISSYRLQISGNSTRRALWHARLGLRPGALLCRLCDVTADGGRASRVRARVYRRYPPLYVEKCPDGSTVTRSERLELQYQMKYEAEREAMMERIYEEVEKEFDEQESQDSEGPSDPTRWYESGSQIAQLMKKSKDPMEFRAQLTGSQVQLLQEHCSKQRDSYLRAVQRRAQEVRTRNLVRIVRGKLAALAAGGTVSTATLSVWKPSDEVLDIFKEGAWVEVTNVMPTAIRNSEIQLSAGRQSAFRLVKSRDDEAFKPHFEALKRTCYTIECLSHNPFMATPCNEIDTAGVVFLIDPANTEFESIKNQFQNLYLADFDKNIICVNFWGGIKKFGYENVLETGQVIYCENLQKRAGNTRKNIPQYRGTEYTFFTKTPKNEMGRNIVDDLNKKLGIDRRKFCEDCVAVKQEYSVIRCFNDSENVTPYRLNRSDYNLHKNKIFIDTPVGIKVRKQDDFNLTGLDFESTFKLDSQELSPATLLRKKKVNEKIARLKMYGEPPPLSAINIINKSKNAANSYKSPLFSKNGGDTPFKSVASVSNVQNDATPKKISNECAESDNVGMKLGSPIISMNRTFVKRNANPVKLNFSVSAAIEENDKAVDHFAEEFDGSPPLSLE